MVWRLLRSVLLLAAGAIAGFAGAAAMLRAALPSRGDAGSDELDLVAIFDGIELASRSTAFRGGAILAWFGGVALDLRAATVAPGARMDVRAVFGGVAIRVPTSRRVEADGTGFAGGLDVSAAEPTETDAPSVAIRAVTFMGGVSVTN